MIMPTSADPALTHNTTSADQHHDQNICSTEKLSMAHCTAQQGCVALPGPVELWLGEVERRMKASVKAQTQASLVDYTTRPRPEWVRRWPAMAVLAVSAISWSQVSPAVNSTVQNNADGPLPCWPCI